MQFLAAATAIFGAFSLAAAAPASQVAAAAPAAIRARQAATPCETPLVNATVYKISGFGARKYDGENVSVVFFNISATNGGTLDFECSPYDPVTDGTTDSFVSSQTYFCGKNSMFSFSYDVDTTQLFLFQAVSPNSNVEGGSLVVGEGVCRAAGSSIDDEICTVPNDAYITMRELGA